MRTTRARALLAALPLVALAACAPAEEDPGTAEEPAADSSPSPAEDECAKENLPLVSPGTLTIATDSPAYEPWFRDNDPTNGEGYESAVAYAVAEELGFSPAEVTWVKVPFNNAYAPGAKNFDFDINQISITPEREEVVDFSEGYYEAAQAVIALEGSEAAEATTLEDLAGLRLGAQTGTTSLTAIRQGIKPDLEPRVFEDTNAAKQALTNGQVDAFLADLPTAFFITAVEIPEGVLVGQFQFDTAQPEEFGLLFEQGNPLLTCVDQVLADLKGGGALDDIEEQWLSDVVDVPELK